MISIALALEEDTHRFSLGEYTSKAWFNLALIWVDCLFPCVCGVNSYCFTPQILLEHRNSTDLCYLSEPGFVLVLAPTIVQNPVLFAYYFQCYFFQAIPKQRRNFSSKERLLLSRDHQLNKYRYAINVSHVIKEVRVNNEQRSLCIKGLWVLILLSDLLILSRSSFSDGTIFFCSQVGIFVNFTQPTVI